MYILNEDLLPVPIKVAGEIYIAGEGLGRGYWQRPDLTAERFLPNPFAIQPGGRLYRTGDQGRYRSDGAIEFMGRLDYQVKIRGFRIELGEIEAVLLSHPQVERAVVLATEGGTGDKQLVAYLVSNAEIVPGELQELLKNRLPNYMVPSVFVSLDKMPLTPSGKIDRRSLPALDRDLASGETPYIEPRTPVEQQLAQIWSEILGRDQIGVYDNFFALGGHSLLATRVVSRMKDSFHTSLSLRQLFEIPTIAGLSEVLEQISRNANGDGLKQEGEAIIGRLTRIRRPPSPAAAD
jgi:acyl carrier protein